MIKLQTALELTSFNKSNYFNTIASTKILSRNVIFFVTYKISNNYNRDNLKTSETRNEFEPCIQKQDKSQR